MGSKQDILAAIRQRTVPAAAAPALDQAWIVYPDPYQQFANSIASVGGRCFAVSSVEDIDRLLGEIPAYAAARQIVSLVPGAGNANVDLSAIDDPHALETVDFAILPGYWGVAENGAIWVTDADVKHRVIYFIAQHLALVIAADKILHNMHQAYERLAFDGAAFGTFISGPSKTADIEQSLVIGAHGPRSLTVFVLA